jgi:hypothetical protein
MAVVRMLPSQLRPDPDGRLRVRILQYDTGLPGVGDRAPPPDLQGPRAASAKEAATMLERLLVTEAGALNLIAYHPGVTAVLDEMVELSADRTLVTLAGVDSRGRNLSWVIESGTVHEQAKISLASEDAGATPGEELCIFQGGRADGAITWAVLNCHDYTDVRLLEQLLEKRVELLVVLTYNNATRLYWEYATADLHRLFCYIAIINVADHGGSAVFAPFRRAAGDKNAQAGLGGQLFAAAGRIELVATVPINIAELRRLRAAFRTDGFAQIDKKDGGAASKQPVAPDGAALLRRDVSVVPSQHFMSTRAEQDDVGAHEAGPPPRPIVVDRPLSWNYESPRIAIAQLRSVPVAVYRDNGYRLAGTQEARTLGLSLASRLDDLRNRLALAPRPNGAALDFLVLPEVFLPQEMLTTHLQPLANELGAIIITGVDYPGDSEAENANQTAVLIPDAPHHLYTKITRSQYDAQGPKGGRRRFLQRGGELLRFTSPGTQHTFGLLVCYDFSHLDLVRQINIEDRDQPLDMLFVIAHNPFAGLYRACCVADAHRFYQAVVMCNVADYGGSGVFMPIRTPGARLTVTELGQGAEAIVLAEPPLADLHEARHTADSVLSAKTFPSGRSFMRKPGIFQGRSSPVGHGS